MPSNTPPISQDEIQARFKAAHRAFLTYLDAYSSEQRLSRELAACTKAFDAIKAIDETLWSRLTQCLDSLVVARANRVFRPAGNGQPAPKCLGDATLLLERLARR